SISVEWSATGAAGTFTAMSASSDCTSTAATAAGPFANPAARFVLVRAQVQYRGFVSQAAGQGPITAAATSVARLTGSPLPTNAPSWPLVRHFTAGDFTQSCGNPCNPTTVTPVTFWDSNEPNIVYNNFMGLVDLSRFSPNEHRNAGQPSCVGVNGSGGS